MGLELVCFYFLKYYKNLSVFFFRVRIRNNKADKEDKNSRELIIKKNFVHDGDDIFLTLKVEEKSRLSSPKYY